MTPEPAAFPTRRLLLEGLGFVPHPSRDALYHPDLQKVFTTGYVRTTPRHLLERAVREDHDDWAVYSSEHLDREDRQAILGELGENP